MKTLLVLQKELQENNQNLVDILSEGDILVSNGYYFSDCDFFTKNKEYRVKVITPTVLKVTSNMSFMSINIFPNGLNAFTLKEEQNNA